MNNLYPPRSVLVSHRSLWEWSFCKLISQVCVLALPLHNSQSHETTYTSWNVYCSCLCYVNKKLILQMGLIDIVGSLATLFFLSLSCLNSVLKYLCNISCYVKIYIWPHSSYVCFGFIVVNCFLLNKCWFILPWVQLHQPLSWASKISFKISLRYFKVNPQQQTG